MAVCTYCNQEMEDSLGCTELTYDDMLDGEKARIPYPVDESAKCHDCGVPPDSLHHPGCDMEVCPQCKGQAIGCDCQDDYNRVQAGFTIQGDWWWINGKGQAWIDGEPADMDELEMEGSSWTN